MDVNTQQSFEALNERAVAVVVDPIQSVKGKGLSCMTFSRVNIDINNAYIYVSIVVVIDAFRLINPQSQMIGQEPRQTTSNIGHLNKPSIQVYIFLKSP